MPRFSSSAATEASPKTLLHAGLGIVKVAVHGIDGHVIAFLGGHLQVLDLAGAVVRVEHLDLNAVQVSIASQCSLAGIAGGCHQNAGRLGAAQHLLGLNQQLRHQLQGVVLEGAGRTVPQLKGIQALADLDRAARLTIKGCAVGGSGGIVQESQRCNRSESPPAPSRPVPDRKVFPALQIGLGESFRYEQTALRCQTADDSLLRGNAECGISGAKILHTFTPFLLFSFLYTYKPFWRYTVAVERLIAGGYGICPYGLQGSMSVICCAATARAPTRREPPSAERAKRGSALKRAGNAMHLPAAAGGRDLHHIKTDVGIA